jgi:preprotein translocase subunit SecA
VLDSPAPVTAEDGHGRELGDDHRPTIVAKGLTTPSAPAHVSYSGPTVDGDAAVEVVAEEEVDQFAGVARNDLCPCGSGRKYKRCHGNPASRNA